MNVAISSGGNDAFGNTLVTAATIDVTAKMITQATGNVAGSGASGTSAGEVAISFSGVRGTPVSVPVTKSGVCGFLEIQAFGDNVSGGGDVQNVMGSSNDEVSVSFQGTAGVNLPPLQPELDGHITVTVTFGQKPAFGGCCPAGGGGCEVEAEEDCGVSHTFLGDQVVCPLACGGPTPSPTLRVRSRRRPVT